MNMHEYDSSRNKRFEILVDESYWSFSFSSSRNSDGLTIPCLLQCFQSIKPSSDKPNVKSYPTWPNQPVGSKTCCSNNDTTRDSMLTFHFSRAAMCDFKKIFVSQEFHNLKWHLFALVCGIFFPTSQLPYPYRCLQCLPIIITQIWQIRTTFVILTASLVEGWWFRETQLGVLKKKGIWKGDLYMDVSKNRGETPQIIHFNRVFHYKPSIFRYPYSWKHPYILYLGIKWESTHFFQQLSISMSKHE